jgi:anti-sigma-K factor RskA
VCRPEGARGRGTWTRLWRRSSGSFRSSIAVVAAIITITVAIVVSITSVSRVGVAIRAIVRVSSRGSRGTRHPQSDGERRGATVGTSKSKRMVQGLTTRAHPCGALANHL